MRTSFSNSVSLMDSGSRGRRQDDKAPQRLVGLRLDLCVQLTNKFRHERAGPVSSSWKLTDYSSILKRFHGFCLTRVSVSSFESRFSNLCKLIDLPYFTHIYTSLPLEDSETISLGINHLQLGDRMLLEGIA